VFKAVAYMIILVLLPSKVHKVLRTNIILKIDLLTIHWKVHFI